MPRTLRRPDPTPTQRSPSPRLAPLSLPNLLETPSSLVAVGAELKSTVCFHERARLLFSSDLGRLTRPDDFRRFSRAIAAWFGELDERPAFVAHDLHPQYLSTRCALSLALPTIAVQHHHAHVVAVMAEAGLDTSVIGISCDGAGFGPDSATWGCEILHCDRASYSRVGHLKYFSLPGGDAAAIDTWRPAAALLHQLYGEEWRRFAPAAFNRVPPRSLDVIEHVLARDPHLPQTSSLGRLFDAVSFLLGLCDTNTQEAQAAMALESASSPALVEPYPYETQVRGRQISMSVRPMLAALLRDIAAGRKTADIAARFHETIARLLAASAVIACDLYGISTVAIAGGCFANRRLRRRLVEILTLRRMRVLEPQRVPCGDAGIAIGQAVCAAAVLRRRADEKKE